MIVYLFITTSPCLSSIPSLRINSDLRNIFSSNVKLHGRRQDLSEITVYTDLTSLLRALVIVNFWKILNSGRGGVRKTAV